MVRAYTSSSSTDFFLPCFIFDVHFHINLYVDVPEGCVIVKEHIPIANLFSCLWFNEVDRFTPRDQISFSTVRDKIISMTNWTINMFLDCERRNFVVQVCPSVGTFSFECSSYIVNLWTEKCHFCVYSFTTPFVMRM